MTLQVRVRRITWRYRDDLSTDIFTQQKNIPEKHFGSFAFGIVSPHFLFWECSASEAGVVRAFL